MVILLLYLPFVLSVFGKKQQTTGESGQLKDYYVTFRCRAAKAVGVSPNSFLNALLKYG